MNTINLLLSVIVLSLLPSCLEEKPEKHTGKSKWDLEKERMEKTSSETPGKDYGN